MSYIIHTKVWYGIKNKKPDPKQFPDLSATEKILLLLLFNQFYPPVFGLALLIIVRCDRYKRGNTIGFKTRCLDPVFRDKDVNNSIRTIFRELHVCFNSSETFRAALLKRSFDICSIASSDSGLISAFPLSKNIP